MKRNQLVNYLDQLLKPELFQDLCPNGLQIEGGENIQKVAFAVSATLESIEEAIKWEADALITHHGVFWSYQKGKPVTGSWGRRIRQIIKKDINLISYHLPLDGHQEYGNAAQLAKKLELNSIEPFGEYKKSIIGAKGQFKYPIMVENLTQRLEKTLDHPIIVSTPNNKDFIETIGIITGGANNDWIQASQAGLDAYLTGEISEYNWHDAKEEGISYFACGHHATERYGVLALKDLIAKEFKLETLFIDSDNPA